MSKRVLPALLVAGACVVFAFFWNHPRVAIAQDGLGREAASRLLSRYNLPPVEFMVPIGEEVNIRMMIGGAKAVDPQLGRQLDSSYGCLKRLGYFDIRVNPRSALRSESVVPLPKSRTIGKKRSQDYLGYREVFVFRAADRVVEQVTGIKRVSSTSARVVFTWKWGNLTDICGCMLPTLRSNEETATATLGLYDDGWRVENTSLDGLLPIY